MVSRSDVSRRRLLGWFAAGALVALAAQLSFVMPDPDRWAGLLRVGSGNPLLGQIESDLGPLHPKGPLGHDGQISYLIARDPFNLHDTAAGMRELDQAPYRYRRIIYPLLAGGFGLLPGWATLAGLVLWAVIGVGLGAASVADIRSRLDLPGWTVPASLVNLGVILSVVLLTSDALALGLGLAAIAFLGRRRLAWALILLAAAALTKEVYLLFAWGAAVWLWTDGRRRAAAVTAVLPVLPLLAWTAWLSRSTGELAPALHHFAVPGAGIVAAMPAWFASEPVGATVIIGILTVLLVAVSLGASMFRGDRLLALCCGIWAVLGLVLSVNVWEVPTNALRVLAPLWPLALLVVTAAVKARRVKA